MLLILLAFVSLASLAAYFAWRESSIAYLSGIFWVIFAADSYLTADPIYYALTLGGIAGAFLMFLSGYGTDKTKRQEAETEAENQRIAAENVPSTWRVSNISKAKGNAARRRAAKNLNNLGI